MTHPIKERINADLQKAKEEGGLRTGRIREIVQAAVSEALAELKEGSGEIRTIAKDAVSAVVENVREKGKEAREEIAASIEGVVEGISGTKREVLAQAQEQANKLQAEINEQEKQLDADIDGALVAIESAEEPATASTNVRSLIDNAIKRIKEQQLPVIQEQYARMKEQLNLLDERLAERYGDRYTEVKQRVETTRDNAKVWYDETRAKAEAGEPTPIEKTQVDLHSKAAEAGVSAAQKEKEIKQRVKAFLQTALDRF